MAFSTTNLPRWQDQYESESLNKVLRFGKEFVKIPYRFIFYDYFAAGVAYFTPQPYGRVTGSAISSPFARLCSAFMT